MHSDLGCIVHLLDGSERHLFAILELGELLHNAVELGDIFVFGLQSQVFLLDGFVGSCEPVLQLRQLGLALQMLVLDAFRVLLLALKPALKTLDLHSELFSILVEVATLKLLPFKHLLTIAQLSSDLLFVILEELNLLLV